jgi:hypothetical protein
MSQLEFKSDRCAHVYKIQGMNQYIVSASRVGETDKNKMKHALLVSINEAALFILSNRITLHNTTFIDMKEQDKSDLINVVTVMLNQEILMNKILKQAVTFDDFYK